MNLAILGGTFNPPHNGHLSIARTVLDETEYDRVIFVPTSVPAHKTVSSQVTPAQRLEMVQIACRGIPGIDFDSCDIDRGGTTYSIDTVTDIARKHPDAGKIGFIIGDDLVGSLHTWRRVDEFIERVELVIAHRQFEDPVVIPFPHRYLHNPMVPFRSHDIRRRIHAGESISGMVPVPVQDYIIQHGLYHDA